MLRQRENFSGSVVGKCDLCVCVFVRMHVRVRVHVHVRVCYCRWQV
jgi:hypothetical protein